MIRPSFFDQHKFSAKTINFSDFGDVEKMQLAESYIKICKIGLVAGVFEYLKVKNLAMK
jgi:hypothetical protein